MLSLMIVLRPVDVVVATAVGMELVGMGAAETVVVETATVKALQRG